MAGKVLLVEDDLDQLEVLALAISLVCKHECVRARSLVELNGLSDQALGCQVALLDVNLGPHQPSGLDAYRWLREHDFRGRICFLTGHARSHPLVIQALALGAARVLEKPIGIDEVCALLANQGGAG
jgi:DNA-binding response OmpR family regulator